MPSVKSSAEPTPSFFEISEKNLEHVVREKVRVYLSSHQNSHLPSHVYHHVMAVVEKALLEEALHFVAGNQSKAASLLGIHRNTLRQKLNTKKTAD